ncbi:hypothetical protein [Vibrio sp. MMH1-50]|uniref:hypothetical protein n=1 Tax=Vibrio TaxID=662 RepID=UPI001EF3C8D4|nr:hypothetical protein [Vibrio sp. MMH1-50]MCG7518011.1 hypothetical protein [Vibrio sp. MMH1-50]
MKKYRVWHFIIDSVGVFSLGLGASYLWLSSKLELSEKVLDIWSGLATELMGAWVVARVVELAIRKDGEYDKVRIRVARNLRFYLNLATRCIEYRYRTDFDQIQRERDWSKRFYAQHHKCFSKDEIADLDNAYSELDEFIESLFVEGVTHEELYSKLAKYSELAHIAEENIFEETTEIP